MTIRELALNWIENSRVSVEEISVEDARMLIGWMDLEEGEVPGLTAEAFAEVWNEILREG